MYPTYSVFANNCSEPKITYEISNLTANTARFIALNLAEGFREVEVICEDTGELVLSIYIDGDLFELKYDELEAIEAVKRYLPDND